MRREEFPVSHKADANSEGSNTMKKFIFPVLLAAAALVPASAIAEETAVTVNISYDKALLATDEGAADVMKSITAQAKDACVTRSPISHAPYTDRTCVKNLTKAAMIKIVEQQEVAGLATAPTFSRQAVTLVADAGQR